MQKLVPVFLLLLLTACGSGSTSDTAPNSSSSSSSSTSSSSSSSSSSSGMLEFMTFTGANQRLMGRFDREETGQVRFTWPGSALEFRFEGTSASIAIASTARVRFVVKVDDETSDLWVNAGNAVYTLASGLNSDTHEVSVIRVTESFAILSAFISDPYVDGTLLSPPAAPTKRLLVIGNSITAGYGNEGENQSCGYSMETSNQQLSYAALAANALGADLHTIAWSGIGAWRSYGETTPVNPNILVRYQRTLADDQDSQWDVTQFVADAILINIGTNDYWDGSAGDEYLNGMTALVNQILVDYPGKPIYLIVSPMLIGATRDAQQGVLNSLASGNVAVLDLGKIETADGFGCDYHPNEVTHTRMALALETRLRQDLGW